MKLRVNVRKACGALCFPSPIDSLTNRIAVGATGGEIHFKLLDLYLDGCYCKYSVDENKKHIGCGLNKCNNIYKEIEMPDFVFEEFLFYYLKELSK